MPQITQGKRRVLSQEAIRDIRAKCAACAACRSSNFTEGHKQPCERKTRHKRERERDSLRHFSIATRREMIQSLDIDQHTHKAALHPPPA
eukprot:1215159-Amphidinium_carterae.2